jgi:DNA-binding CsgD family transcriptional regulator/PAS domain-containing protein
MPVTSELTELSATIGDLYDAAIDPTLWQTALKSICAYVGGSSAALLWHDAGAQRSEALYLFNDIPLYTQLYFEKYLPMNPMFPAASFIDVGVVTVDDDVVPRDEFVQTRFYKEWVKPQGIAGALAVNLEKGATRTSMINIRTDVAVTDEMRRRLALLVPHLQRAVTISKLFDQNAAREQALTQTLDHVEAAIVMVAADGRIAFANDAARKMLAEGTVVREQGEAFHAAAPVADRVLRDIFASAEEGDASLGERGIAVPLTSAPQEPWFAHVLPLTSGRRSQAGQDYAAAAAVFIRKTMPNAPPPLEAAAKFYKLTAGEVRVLDAIMKVNGVKAMAETLGLSQATVKTHLHNLFRKTGTKRQSELVKLVAGL